MPLFSITVSDMACGACADTISRAVREVDLVAKVSTNLDSKVVEINSGVTPEVITQAIKRAGYTVNL